MAFHATNRHRDLHAQIAHDREVEGLIDSAYNIGRAALRRKDIDAYVDNCCRSDAEYTLANVVAEKMPKTWDRIDPAARDEAISDAVTKLYSTGALRPDGEWVFALPDEHPGYRWR